MASDSVAQAISKLTEIQAKAACWGTGPLLVLAGPGSGKTRVLTSRIARLLDESPDAPFRILALTFTNKAADEMRSRVEQLVPDQAQRVFLGTFHSFCADVLRQHGSHVGVRPDFRIYSTKPDIDEVMAQAVSIAAEAGVPVGRNDAALYPVIERLRSRLIAPADAGEEVVEAELRQRIGQIYLAYEQSLSRSNALDFASLIYVAVMLFRKFPAVAKLYRTAFTYWNIDEFQDTNASQYELVRALAGDRFKNLLVVADDDQIIYQWNGASHRRLEEFKKDFSPELVQLPTNFRCPPEVVRIANNLIRHNSLRSAGKQDLVAARPASMAADTIRLGVYATDGDEARAAAADIRARHNEHLGRVAVLARSRKLLEAVKRECDAIGVATVISQRRDAFVSAPYRFLMAVLSLSNHRRDERALEVLCLTFKQLSGLDVEAGLVAAAARAGHDDFLRGWCEAAVSVAKADAKKIVEAVDGHMVRSTDYRTFVPLCQAWFAQLATADQAASLEERFAGFEDDDRAWRDVFPDVLHALRESATLEAFLQELELRSKEPPPSADTVLLMTVHASKGKEFHHVYLVGLAEDQMPSFQANRKGPTSPEMEEERRNCFVAITRTIESLTLTCAFQYSGYAKAPSRFLTEMGYQVPKLGAK